MRALFERPELRDGLVERGRARAAGFGWDRTADAALASYDRALRAAASPAARPH